MGKAEYMYRCECGRVFDSKETYERGLIPLYGKEKKQLFTKEGSPIIDKNGNIIYQKCHICRRKGKHRAGASTTLVDRILEYLNRHKTITSEDYLSVGATTRRSFSTTAAIMIWDGLIERVDGRHRPQQYRLKVSI